MLTLGIFARGRDWSSGSEVVSGERDPRIWRVGQLCICERPCRPVAPVPIPGTWERDLIWGDVITDPAAVMLDQLGGPKSSDECPFREKQGKI